MPKPSLLPSAKQAAPVAFLTAAQPLTNSLHVLGGAAGSSPARSYSALL